MQQPPPGWVPAQQAAPASPSGGSTGFTAPGADAPQVPSNIPLEKPSLLKELPIAAYVLTGIAGAGGAVVYWFGGKAQDELKDPAQHTTPDQTHSLVVRARVGQVLSYVLFPVTGLTALWGTISTVRAVMKISKFVKSAPAVVGVVPMPGGLAAGLEGRF